MGGQLPPALFTLTRHVEHVFMYNYFSHPSNLRQSSMIVPLLMQEGFAGYGLYMAMLEVLRDANDYKFSGDPKVWAFVLHAQDVDQVRRVLDNYGLFDRDDNGLVFSPWLTGSLVSYEDKKTRLQEAGRKGAAKRWAAARKEDGQAIANPSLEDGQAIAYNITKYNPIEQNESQSNQGDGQDWRGVLSIQSKKVDADYLEVLSSTQQEGHAPAYVAQVCMHFGMTEAVCDFICERTNNAEVTHPIYRKFCAIVTRLNGEKWKPNLPANFFLAKLFN